MLLQVTRKQQKSTKKFYKNTGKYRYLYTIFPHIKSIWLHISVPDSFAPSVLTVLLGTSETCRNGLKINHFSLFFYVLKRLKMATSKCICYANKFTFIIKHPTHYLHLISSFTACVRFSLRLANQDFDQFRTVCLKFHETRVHLSASVLYNVDTT